MHLPNDKVLATNSSNSTGGGNTPRLRACVSRLLCALALLAITGSASAEIYKCTIDGKLVFQDRSCADGVEEMLGKAADPIHDLHPSWFDIPSRLRRNPVCTTDACHCGGREFALEKDQDLRLVGALLDLEHQWNSHQRELTRISNVKDPTAVDLAEIRDSACDVAVGQSVIKSLYNTVAADIVQTAATSYGEGKDVAPGCQPVAYADKSRDQQNSFYGACTRSLQTAGRSRSRSASPMHDMLQHSLESLRQPRRTY